jgi:glycosyltransferase involved in cell wall biosynthesis
VLWLHTQPDHYFSRLMDDLAGCTGYRLGPAGGAVLPSTAFEWVAAFSTRGPAGGVSVSVPAVARAVFLTERPGCAGRRLRFRERRHVDWRAELLPLGFDAAIVSGYGSRTHREVILECQRRGVPVALWSDSNIWAERGGGLNGRVKRAAKRRFLRPLIEAAAVQLTANSRGVAYWRYYGAARERIVVCPYYADYAGIERARKVPREAVVARAGLPAGARYLLSVARLVRAKGLDLAIEAFQRLGLAGEGLHYVIAGAGREERALKDLAGEAVGRSIHFVGHRGPGEVFELMAGAEALVAPSRVEPHGIVVAEALAAGTPVVASDAVGAAADLVVAGVSGERFRAGRGDALQSALRRALAAERLAALRRGARPAFEAWYGRTSPVARLPGIVNRMLAGRQMETAEG